MCELRRRVVFPDATAAEESKKSRQAESPTRVPFAAAVRPKRSQVVHLDFSRWLLPPVADFITVTAAILGAASKMVF
ncbi:hypothetical protein GWI33_015700 [Rhynchophorus ferrugineus]|uniref:Uncharacterized protein n=1 Tax=Rhynchophorus ferrugineus TaxID=354439 RepID=A0A834I1Z0_RHYFE|nr:hypothetical protein GWI33_015700 [Rhynchophorus ferrugineus]